MIRIGLWLLPTESARFGKATPIRAVARGTRYVPLRFTSRAPRRAFQEPREKGTGGEALGDLRRRSGTSATILPAFT